MQATSTDKKTFQLIENGQQLGELIYENLFFLKAEIRLTNSELYQIKPVGISRILLQNTEHISMDWLAKKTCLCSRQFERKFIERMGVTPSLFARIARFDKAFLMKNAQSEKDWLSIAIHCGYYDYQHLARNYKEFTGLTPTSFFQLDNQAPERIFGLHE